MTRYIEYLGIEKFPFNKILSVMKHKDTIVDQGADVVRENFYRNRNKKQLKFSKKVRKLYQDKKNFCYFYRYKNTKKIASIIPKTFWKKYKIDEKNCDIRLLVYKPGTCSIPHIDRYAELGGLGKSKPIKRLWITMTEPKIGHALFVENQVAYNLEKGTVLSFPSDVVHAGCNVGHHDRIIMTITGLHYG